MANRRISLAATAAVAVAMLSGCATGEDASKPDTLAMPSATTTPTSTPDRTPNATGEPAVVVQTVFDPQVAEVFGTTKGIGALAQTWAGVTLGNGSVIAGDVEPFNAVAGLPLSDALKAALSKPAKCDKAGTVTTEMCPALEVMPDNLKTDTITGTGARLDSMTTPDITLSTFQGDPAVRLTFTSTATWDYTENGNAKSQTLTQDVVLWVLPDQTPTTWYVVNYQITAPELVEG